MQTKKKKYLNERNCAENDTGLLMSERDKNSVSDLKPTIVKAKKIQGMTKESNVPGMIQMKDRSGKKHRSA